MSVFFKGEKKGLRKGTKEHKCLGYYYYHFSFVSWYLNQTRMPYGRGPQPPVPNMALGTSCPVGGELQPSWNHPHPTPGPWENGLPQNRSPVPQSLGTAASRGPYHSLSLWDLPHSLRDDYILYVVNAQKFTGYWNIVWIWSSSPFQPIAK